MDYYISSTDEIKKQIIIIGSKIHKYIADKKIDESIGLECIQNALSSQLKEAEARLDIMIDKNEKLSTEIKELKELSWRKQEKMKQEHMEELLQQKERGEKAYRDNIEMKEQMIEDLRKRVREVAEETEERFKFIIEQKDEYIQQFRKDNDDKLSLIIQQKDERYAEVKELYEREREKQDNFKEKNTKSVTRGEIGQNELIEMIGAEWTNDWIFEDCSKKAEYMDIRVTNKVLGIKGGLEIKNFTSDVSKRDIDKFERDAKLRKEYDFGVMISMNTGISRKDILHMDLCKETQKPLFYLSRLKEYPKILKFLECYLKYWFIHKINKSNGVDHKQILIQQMKQRLNENQEYLKSADKMKKLAIQNINSVTTEFSTIFNENIEDIEMKKEKNINKNNVNQIIKTNNTRNSKLYNYLDKRIQYDNSPIALLNLNKLWENMKDRRELFPENLVDDTNKKRSITNHIKMIIDEKGWKSRLNSKKRIFTNLICRI
jgi:DNA anti-recombination protein RmuC